jgi:hypothetical protein
MKEAEVDSRQLKVESGGEERTDGEEVKAWANWGAAVLRLYMLRLTR